MSHHPLNHQKLFINFLLNGFTVPYNQQCWALTTCLATGIVVRQCILQIIPIRIVLESVQTYLTGLSHVHMHGLFKENEASYEAYIKIYC